MYHLSLSLYIYIYIYIYLSEACGEVRLIEMLFKTSPAA